MNSFIASQVREIAAELILDALENGDPIGTAKNMRVEIEAGFLQALKDSGMPEEYINLIKF